MKSLFGKLTFLSLSGNSLNCPLQIFNSILKTPTIQRLVVSFIITFYKIYSFLSHLLEIYFFKELITQYLTTRCRVIINVMSKMT